MKPITIITACAALLAASVGSWAEDTGDTRAFGNGVLPDYLAMYDIDDSGDLSRDELDTLNADRTNPDRHRKFREQWDSNRDGQVDSDEKRAAKIEIRRRIERRRNQRFDAVDTGVNDIGANDGFLNFREFSRIAAVAASNLDSPGMAERLFNHLDKNDDKLVSRLEFLQSLDNVRPSPTVAPQPRPHPANTLGDGGNGN